MADEIIFDPFEDHYYGSRKFEFIADIVGLPVDQLNFVLAQIFALVLAYYFRVWLKVGKASPAKRHWSALSAGTLLSYFCFGKQILFAVLLVIVCYCILVLLPPNIFHHATLLVSLIFLGFVHINKQYRFDGKYVIDVTGPLMIIVQKASSLAYSLHDGKYKDQTKLTDMQNKHKIKSVPSALEYFSYLCCFQSILVGPYFMFSEYQDFINGTQYIRWAAAQKSTKSLVNNNATTEINGNVANLQRREANSAHSNSALSNSAHSSSAHSNSEHSNSAHSNSEQSNSEQSNSCGQPRTDDTEKYCVQSEQNNAHHTRQFDNGISVNLTPMDSIANETELGVFRETGDADPRPFIRRKLCSSLACGLLLVLVVPHFTIGYLKEEEFLNSSFVYKSFYIVLTTTMARQLYYTAWSLTDSICAMSGLGFNGFDKDGNSKWDLITNVNIYQMETASNLKETLEAWNIGTMRWLRFLVYERAQHQKTFLTYFLSCIWHGFYPGYYLTFMGGAFFTQVARLVRRLCRNRVIALGTRAKFAYDVCTAVATKLCLAYLTFPFVLLQFWASIYVYNSLYYSLHFVGIFIVFALPPAIATFDRWSKKSKQTPSNNVQTSHFNQSTLTNFKTE